MYVSISLQKIISVQLAQRTHRRCDILHVRYLYSLSFFFLQWSSCSLLMAIFSKVLGHHSWRVLKIIKKKPILQPKLKWWIYVPIVVWRVFKRRGEWGEAAALAEEKSQQFGHSCTLDILWTRRATTTELSTDNLCNFSVQCVCLMVLMLMGECEILQQIGSQAVQM